MRPRHPFLDHPGPLAIAHRGGAGEAPENSWAAFERTVAMGYRYMETDVRTTSDGVVVAFHDPGLERVAHRPGLIAGTTWAALRSLPLDDGRPVPRLDELLAAWPEVRWNIDIKTSSAIRPVTEALSAAGALDRTLVASFSDLRAWRARRILGPGLATGSGRTAVALFLAAKYVPVLALAVRPAPTTAQVPLARWGVPILDKRFVSACHHAGTAVHVWTIDDAETMDRLLDMGVDGLMTDRPTTLKEVLTRRGQWRA